jgi:probable H4MPT-linked C1 transfer pathway protein
VDAILRAVANVSRSRPVKVWSTDGVFLTTTEARANHLKVAAANWHALATLAGQYMPEGMAVLVDVGSTTTDIVPLLDGRPVPLGKTDPDRLAWQELVYTGVRRTPVFGVTRERVAAELFATTYDVYLVLGNLPENEADTDTADGRPATRQYAYDRLRRMLCGDRETISAELVEQLAHDVMMYQRGLILDAFGQTWCAFQSELDRQGRRRYERYKRTAVVCGSGEFLAQSVTVGHEDCEAVLSVADRLGPAVSACAPAYAVAVLATGRRPAS